MDLKSFLRDTPEVDLFIPDKHNQEVLDLMAESPMSVGGIELLYDRAPEFQRLLRYQADRYLTVLGIRPEKQTTSGFYSISSAVKWIHGKKAMCAYIGDFRTDHSRKSALLWRKYYGTQVHLFSESEELGKPEYILTAILKKNMAAIQSLVNSKKDLGFRYDFLAEPQMVNVYGKRPFKAKSKMQAAWAKASDAAELKEFILSQERGKLFGIAEETWAYRQKTWPNFSVENFLTIRKENRIVAATLPWDPGDAKRMSVLKVPSSVSMLFSFLRLIGFSLPRVGESLRTLYLTHLQVDESLDPAEAVDAFLQEASLRYPGYHMLSFADATGFSNSLKGYILQKVPVMIYAVRRSQDPILSTQGKPVSFEMGLV